jgi:hypothetical protein
MGHKAKARGKRQEARGKRQEARGKRQEARGTLFLRNQPASAIQLIATSAGNISSVMSASHHSIRPGEGPSRMISNLHKGGKVRDGLVLGDVAFVEKVEAG